MSQVAATMGYTMEELNTQGSEAQQTFDTLSAFAQQMGSTTAFSASQAADALNYMALAGYDAETSMTMLPNVLNLAAAGGIELAAASDMVTDAQTALGLSLDETAVMVDQMAKASSKSNTSVAQLGEAFLTVGGNAKNLSGGTLELSQVLGVMADNGIKGGEAGTHLRNIMLALNPTTDAAAAAFEQLGLQAYDANGSLRPMEDIFLDLGDALDGMTDQEKTDIISSIFNKTDLAAVNALLSTSADRWGELSAAIDDSAGAASAMAEVQLDNLNGDITLFKSALEGAQIAVSDGLTPSIRDFVKLGSRGLSEMTEAFKTDGLSGAMEAFGTILSDGITMVVEKVPEMLNAATQLLSAFGHGIMDNLPLITETATQIILTLVTYIISALPDILDAGVQILTSVVDGIAEALPDLIPVAVEAIATIAETLTNPDSMGRMIDSALNLIIKLAEGLIQALPRLIEAVPKIIESIVNTTTQNFPKIITVAAQLITELAIGLVKAIPTLVQAVPKLVSALVNGFQNMMGNIRNIGENIVQGVWQGIQNMWSTFYNNVSNFFSNIVSSVKGALGIHSPSRVFANIGKMMTAGLNDGWEDNIDGVKKMIDADMSSLVHGATAEIDYSASVGGKLSNGLSKLYASAAEGATIIVQSVLDGKVIGETATKYQHRKDRAFA